MPHHHHIFNISNIAALVPFFSVWKSKLQLLDFRFLLLFMCSAYNFFTHKMRQMHCVSMINFTTFFILSMHRITIQWRCNSRRRRRKKLFFIGRGELIWLIASWKGAELGEMKFFGKLLLFVSCELNEKKGELRNRTRTTTTICCSRRKKIKEFRFFLPS